MNFKINTILEIESDCIKNAKEEMWKVTKKINNHKIKLTIDEEREVFFDNTDL